MGTTIAIVAGVAAFTGLVAWVAIKVHPVAVAELDRIGDPGRDDSDWPESRYVPARPGQVA